MEGNGRRAVGVVPSESAVPLLGSQTSGEPPSFFTVGNGNERDLDSVEAGLREAMVKLLQSEQLTEGQQGRAPPRH